MMLMLRQRPFSSTVFFYEGVDFDLRTVHPFSHTLTLGSYLDSTELPVALIHNVPQ